MKRATLLASIAAIVLTMIMMCAAGARADEGADVDAAKAAAQAWLKRIDAGQYGQAWNSTSAFFRKAMPKEQFAHSLDIVRKPLGAVTSRKLKSAAYMTAIPNAPAGKYVVIQYATDFAGKKDGVETITPMLDKDGHWRVSGYYIR
ncbi:MAG TPA: DUF4019 domain-containing protein [Candidatus Binataceae bacterium]|nr:DUF4019 domain-containing protein [Candidatus Binataceae bacterium]